MFLQRLNWAGGRVVTNNHCILIDPVYKSPDVSFFGRSTQPFSQMKEIGTADTILITHLHSDHFDSDFIISKFGSDIPVLVPKGVEKFVKDRGLTNVKGMSVNEVYNLGEISVTASHSVDGLGDNQVSWIVKDPIHTIIHCGDTLWHGYWREIKQKYGSIDAAFLPINGAVVNEPGEIGSKQPICMTPEQAVSAARVLEARLLIPIHYGSFHNPPIYFETENAEQRLITTAMEENISVHLLKPMENLEI